MARKYKVKTDTNCFSARTPHLCNTPPALDTYKVEERQTVELGIGWVKPQYGSPHKLRTVPSIALPFLYMANVFALMGTTGVGWAFGVGTGASGCGDCGGAKCPSGSKSNTPSSQRLRNANRRLCAVVSRSCPWRKSISFRQFS